MSAPGVEATTLSRLSLVCKSGIACDPVILSIVHLKKLYNQGLVLSRVVVVVAYVFNTSAREAEAGESLS